MTQFEALRWTDGDLITLVEGPNGYQCSEGNLIVLRSRTTDVPHVRLCGEELPLKSLRLEGDEFIGEFERLIDTWAGRTSFSLAAGSTRQYLQLDIGPAEKKLGPSAWDAMIQELSEISLSLPWGLSPGAASGRMIPDSLATVHPAIIEDQLPIFGRLLRRLLADPPTQTLRVRTVRPLEFSRGVDLRTIRWLSRRPLELAGVRGLATDNQLPDARALADQPATVASLDHPITRYIAYLLEKVRQRLVETASSLRLPAGHGVPDPSATTYAHELASRVDHSVKAIEVVQRASLFRNLRAEPLSDPVLQSLPDHPLYSAIHRVGRRLIDPGLAYAPGQDVYSALKNSYDLFELLVLYRLVDGIDEELGPAWRQGTASSVKRLPREDRPPDRSIWTWIGPDDQALELRYQALFGSAKPPPDYHFLSSLSAQGVPDYILVLRRGDAIVSWIILDAKYRSGRQAIHDALADIHRYRDGLRVAQMPAAAAYIIVPSLQVDAALYGSSPFLVSHSFGALCLNEENWMDPVWSWFRSTQPILR